jgi:hypothetical protein
MYYPWMLTRAFEKALKNHHFRLASGLLKLLPRISLQAAFGATIQYGPERLLRKLLLSGVKIDSTQRLIDARNSPVEAPGKMKTLVRSGLDVNGYIGPRRLKLLNFAILSRDQELFSFLMEQKADTQTADRNDLLPLQAALMVEEKSFENALRNQGAATGSSQILSILESLIINENMFFSELHELMKWCFKNSGFELLRTTLPKQNLLRYRIRNQAIELRTELRFISAEEITLLLFKGEEVLPIMSLLPRSGKIDSKTLRGHVVTELKEFLKHARNKDYQRPQEASASTAEKKALQVLGLRKDAEEKEIISAYRTLAKKYHPDVGSKNIQDMINLNKAYEQLRKK